jgi:hypothetical protein
VGVSDRARTLNGIRKCLSDACSLFQQTIDALDRIGRASLGTGLTPIMGGYGMKNPQEDYRKALIILDSAEKALHPLAIRLRDGRVNSSHFEDEQAIVLVRDVTEFDYGMLISLLSERRSKDSVSFRLIELKKKAKEAYDLVSSE